MEGDKIAAKYGPRASELRQSDSVTFKLIRLTQMKGSNTSANVVQMDTELVSLELLEVLTYL